MSSYRDEFIDLDICERCYVAFIGAFLDRFKEAGVDDQKLKDLIIRLASDGYAMDIYDKTAN